MIRHPSAGRSAGLAPHAPDARGALAALAAAAGVVALLWPGPLAAEPQPPASFEEEMVVSEVLLDAVVSDRKGRVILGLTADDFVVTEGGREVEILGVSFYSAYEQVPDTTVDLPGFALDRVPTDRHFILFLQEPGTGALSLGRVRSRLARAGAALGEWVATGLSPSDWVAVVSYRKNLKVHLDFTGDRAALAAAIDRAVRGADPESQWPSRQRPESEIGPLLRALPAGKELRRRSRSLHEGLRLLAAAASTVGGRKNLVFLGTGFDSLDQGERFRLWRTVQALNEANVAAYALDLMPSHIRHSSRGSLQSLALDTGGELFFNSIGFGVPLERIAEATAGYYLIAYRSRHPAGDSGYQRVRIRVANPELVVRARDGYVYGEREEEQKKKKRRRTPEEPPRPAAR